MKEFLKLTCWCGAKFLIRVSNIQQIDEDKDGSVLVVTEMTKKGHYKAAVLFVKESVEEISEMLGV